MTQERRSRLSVGRPSADEDASAREERVEYWRENVMQSEQGFGQGSSKVVMTVLICCLPIIG